MKKENLKLFKDWKFWRTVIPLQIMLLIYKISVKLGYKSFIPDVMHYWLHPYNSDSKWNKKFKCAGIPNPTLWTRFQMINYERYILNFSLKTILKAWYDGLFRPS